MIFDFISITGADDSTDLRFISDITIEYPVVEWGILFSDKRQGQPRYPSRAWLERLDNESWNHVAFAAHLCGSVCDRMILDEGVSFCDGSLLQMNPLPFNRVQLNGFSDNVCSTSTINTLASRLYDCADVILQIPDDKTLMRCQHTFLGNVSFLHDASRGTGLEPSEWPEPGVDGYVGYAGGINLGNIERTLDELCARPSDRHFWLDLESGVFTDNQFDPRKVEELLQISHQYISRG